IQNRLNPALPRHRSSEFVLGVRQSFVRTQVTRTVEFTADIASNRLWHCAPHLAQKFRRKQANDSHIPWYEGAPNAVTAEPKLVRKKTRTKPAAQPGQKRGEARAKR